MNREHKKYNISMHLKIPVYSLSNPRSLPFFPRDKNDPFK